MIPTFNKLKPTKKDSVKAETIGDTRSMNPMIIPIVELTNVNQKKLLLTFLIQPRSNNPIKASIKNQIANTYGAIIIPLLKLKMK